MELSLGRQIAKRTVSEAIAPTATSWAEFKEGRYKSPSSRRHREDTLPLALIAKIIITRRADWTGPEAREC